MRKLIAVLLLSSIILSGCWDKVELNDRAYINSISIDKADNEKDKGEGEDDKTTGEKSFLVALAVSDLKAFEGNDNGGKDEAENKSIKKAEGQTVSAAIRYSETHSSHKQFLGHAKAVFLGEELLKDRKLLAEALDALERDKELSRKTLVLAAERKAEGIISVKPAGEPSIGVFADNFFKVNQGGTTFAMTLEDLFIKLRSGNSVMIPKIKEKDGEIVIGGGAVLKNLELCGFADEQETRGIMWQKKIKDAEVIVEHNGASVPFTVKSHSAKTSFYDSGTAPVMITDISVSGSVDEYTFGSSLDEKKLKEIEELVAKQIESEVQKANKKMQKELKADVAGMSRNLRKKNYDIWEKYGTDAFEKMETLTNVNVKIKSAGLIK